MIRLEVGLRLCNFVSLKKTDMQTIRLKISDEVYDRFLKLLNEFSTDEIEIIEDAEFDKSKAYLKRELEEMEDGSAVFLEEEEVYERLENTIRKHET